MRFEDLGEFGKLLAGCPNLGVLITKIDHYFATYTNGIKILHGILGNNVHWFFSLHPDIKDHRRHYTELTMAFLQNVIKMAGGENWTASEVHFEHIPWGQRRDMEKVFQTSLKYSMKFNALVFPKKVLCLPIKKNPPPEKNKKSDLIETAPGGTFAIVLKQVLKPGRS